MTHNIIILYFCLPYFHVSNSLFSTQYFSTLSSHRRSLDTFYTNSGLIFYLCLARDLANEGKRYICNVFFQWPMLYPFPNRNETWSWCWKCISIGYQQTLWCWKCVSLLNDISRVLSWSKAASNCISNQNNVHEDHIHALMNYYTSFLV